MKTELEDKSFRPIQLTLETLEEVNRLVAGINAMDSQCPIYKQACEKDPGLDNFLVKLLTDLEELRDNQL